MPTMEMEKTIPTVRPSSIAEQNTKVIDASLEESAATLGASAQELTAEPDRKTRVRMHYLVDWRAQLHDSALSVGVVVALLVLLNIAFRNFVEVASTAGAGHGGVDADLFSSLQWRQVITLALSAGVLVGFIGLRILESHRIYGALFNISRELGAIEEGRYSVTVVLRSQDRLQGLAGAVNGVVASLQHRSQQRIKTLSGLATRADLLGSEGRVLGSEIEAMIEQERSLLRS